MRDGTIRSFPPAGPPSRGRRAPRGTGVTYSRENSRSGSQWVTSIRPHANSTGREVGWYPLGSAGQGGPGGPPAPLPPS
jgi:hypothetical protein